MVQCTLSQRDLKREAFYFILEHSEKSPNEESPNKKIPNVGKS